MRIYLFTPILLVFLLLASCFNESDAHKRLHGTWEAVFQNYAMHEPHLEEFLKDQEMRPLLHNQLGKIISMTIDTDRKQITFSIDNYVETYPYVFTGETGNTVRISIHNQEHIYTFDGNTVIVHAPDFQLTFTKKEN